MVAPTQLAVTSPMVTSVVAPSVAAPLEYSNLVPAAPMGTAFQPAIGLAPAPVTLPSMALQAPAFSTVTAPVVNSGLTLAAL